MANDSQPVRIPSGFSEVAADESIAAALLALDAWAFPAPQEIEELLTWALPHDWSRVRALRADGSDGLAAMHSSYAFSRFPVPGATTPAAGLSWVGVHPQYRRRGLLTSMIATHLADCARRTEAISVLTASEPAIYGRFGYGVANQVARLSIPRKAALRPVSGSEAITVSVEMFTEQQHSALVSDLHERAAAIVPNRPGWATRETPELQAYFLLDPASLRDGFEAMRILVATQAGEPTGYALFRRKLDWSSGAANGTLAVREAVGLNPATVHALWARLLDFDLMSTVTVSQVVMDDPLLSLLVDARAAQPTLRDNLWVRLVDVPAALRARRYSAPLDVTVAITDESIPANQGTWRLRADAFSDRVEVTPADRATVSLDVRELGSIYLGGISAAALAQAGLIDGPAAEMTQLSAAFSWPRLPGTSWIF
jgi:predicted acetyltransferase